MERRACPWNSGDYDIICDGSGILTFAVSRFGIAERKPPPAMYERKDSVLEFPRMRATQVESPQDVVRWISTPLLAIGNGAVDTR